MTTLKTILTNATAIAVASAFVFPVLLSGPAKAFPDGPIEFVIPFGAGGGADIEGRVLAKEMSKVLGVPVVPINKPGAGGAVTYTYVKNSKPNGNTIAWSSTSILTTTNIGNVPYGYDAFDHIGRVEYQPMPFAVKGDAPYKTLKAFAAACKKAPGTLKVANSSAGSATHLAAIALMDAIGCKAIHLPAGVTRRNATVLSGESNAMIAPLTGAVNLAKAKKIRVLAMPSEKRNAVMPNVPTAKELGFDAELDLFRSLSVAKGTPIGVKAKLAGAMTAAANSKAFTDLAEKNGFTIAPMQVGQFEAYLKQENAKVVKIMKAAGLYQSKMK
ncbi:MAG: tripartite tricarboxylate transporter substrate binding protein [Proteobacteria bacterium]|nr:tripartite tricarboxylate transporter substrate binding protein [Pseudomonadota bacterium]